MTELTELDHHTYFFKYRDKVDQYVLVTEFKYKSGSKFNIMNLETKHILFNKIDRWLVDYLINGWTLIK